MIIIMIMIIIIIIIIIIVIIMRFSPAFNSFWVFYATSQLLPAAQRRSTFLRMCDVPNKAVIWALPVISGIPRILDDDDDQPCIG